MTFDERDNVKPVSATEFKARIEKLNDEGLVDFKAEIDVNNHTSTRDLMVVINHMFKMREAGQYEEVASYEPVVARLR